MENAVIRKKVGKCMWVEVENNAFHWSCHFGIRKNKCSTDRYFISK